MNDEQIRAELKELKAKVDDGRERYFKSGEDIKDALSKAREILNQLVYDIALEYDLRANEIRVCAATTCGCLGKEPYNLSVTIYGFETKDDFQDYADLPEEQQQALVNICREVQRRTGIKSYVYDVVAREKIF